MLCVQANPQEQIHQAYIHAIQFMAAGICRTVKTVTAAEYRTVHTISSS